MWDELVGALLTAAATALAGEVVSKLITGKWLHEHLYEWWRALSEQIDAWVKENESIGIVKVIGFVNRKLDNVVVGANRLVKMGFYAVDKDKKKHAVIEEVELSADEIAEQFPELRLKKQTMVMEVSYADAEQDSATVQQQVPHKKSGARVYPAASQSWVRSIPTI